MVAQSTKSDSLPALQIPFRESPVLPCSDRRNPPLSVWPDWNSSAYYHDFPGLSGAGTSGLNETAAADLL